MISTKLTASNCKSLVDRITSRVSSWTARFLSFAGRLQLIQSVLCGIQSFWNGLFILPKAVIKKIERILRQFLWKGPHLGTGGAKVGWEDLSLPKKEGGLGIKKLTEWNVAAMSKHLWDLSHPTVTSCWATWARANLLRGRSLWDISISSSCSWTWRKVLQLRPIYRQQIKYHIGDGRHTSLWFDDWLLTEPIHQVMGDRVIYDAGLPRNATVSSIIHGHSWQWPPANSTELLVLKETTNSLPYSPSGGQDSIQWLPIASGRFSICSAWAHIREVKALVPWRHMVWFSGNLPKASFILWLAVKRCLGTQDRLHNLPLDTVCLFCSLQLESHDHLFFDCPYSRQLWRSISQKGNFTSPTIPWELLISWVSSCWKGHSLQIKINLLCLSITIYHLWRERNDIFHSHSSKSVQDLVVLIEHDVRLKLSTYREVRDTPHHRALQVVWSLPDSIFSSG